MCINQDDNLEKSHQVRMLHMIYAQAHVVSWLGNDNDVDMNSLSFYLPLLARLWTLLVRKPEKETKSMFHIKHAVAAEFISYLNDNDAENIPKFTWQMLHRIFGADYFSRVWTIQEVILGKTNTCQLGAATFPLAIISVAARVIPCCDLLPSFDPPWYFLANVENALTLYLEPAVHRHWKMNETDSDMSIAAQASLQRCSDPRDHVYGLTSLFRNPDAYPIDYSLSESQVLANFAAHCLSQKGFENISVHHSFADAGDQEDDSQPNTPSWCTDVMQVGNDVRGDLGWDQGLTLKPALNAAGSHPFAFQSSSRSSHTIRGVAGPKLRACGDILDRQGCVLPVERSRHRGVSCQGSNGSGTWSSLLGCSIGASCKKALTEAMQHILLPTRGDLGQRRFTRFSEQTQSLFNRINPNDLLQQLFLPIYLARIDPELLPIAGFEFDSRVPRTDEEIIEETISLSTEHRNRDLRMFTTKNHHLGTVAAHVQVDDILCTIYGSSLPLIIRKVEGTENHFFIGACHAPWVMYGESLELGLSEQEFTLV